MPTFHAITALIRAGNTRKGADSLSNFCLGNFIIKFIKLYANFISFISGFAR